jgi:hypothetical protein
VEGEFCGAAISILRPGQRIVVRSGETTRPEPKIFYTLGAEVAGDSTAAHDAKKPGSQGRQKAVGQSGIPGRLAATWVEPDKWLSDRRQRSIVEEYAV